MINSHPSLTPGLRREPRRRTGRHGGKSLTSIGLTICRHHTSEISNFNDEYMQESETRVPISRCTWRCCHRRWEGWQERAPCWSINSPCRFVNLYSTLSTPKTYLLFLGRISKHVVMEHGSGPLSNPSTIAVVLRSKLAWNILVLGLQELLPRMQCIWSYLRRKRPLWPEREQAWSTTCK